MTANDNQNNIQPEEADEVESKTQPDEKISWWNKHKNSLTIISNWAIAGATIFLAFATFIHIKTTSNMSEQTKRLADLSVEQFKIRAYPSFLIKFEEIKFEKDKLREVYKVINKGEITAQKATFLFAHIYGKKLNFEHVNRLGAYYKIDKLMTSLDFQVNIFSNAYRKIISEGSLHNNYKIENLLYSLLFIKFWVPYDDKYRYESFGFIMKKDISEKNKKELKWQDIDINSKNNLINNYFEASAHKTSDKVIKFFDDYPFKPVSTKESDS